MHAEISYNFEHNVILGIRNGYQKALSIMWE